MRLPALRASRAEEVQLHGQRVSCGARSAASTAASTRAVLHDAGQPRSAICPHPAAVRRRRRATHPARHRSARALSRAPPRVQVTYHHQPRPPPLGTRTGTTPLACRQSPLRPPPLGARGSPKCCHLIGQYPSRSVERWRRCGRWRLLCRTWTSASQSAQLGCRCLAAVWIADRSGSAVRLPALMVRVADQAMFCPSRTTCSCEACCF